MTAPSPRPILVADDDVDDEFLIRHRLGKGTSKQPVLLFHDGAEVIEFLEQLRADGGECPGLLLLDLKMPKVDGFDVLSWIRSQKDLEGLTVIVVTSSEREDDKARALLCGAREVLLKFPSVEELASVVARFG